MTPPKHWTQTTLGELCEPVTSGSRDCKPYYGRGSGVFILSQSVRMRRLELASPFHIDPPEDDAARQRSQVRPEDLLVNIDGGVGTVARVRQTLDDHWVCQSVALVRLADPSLAPFVELYLSAPDGGQEHFARTTYGIGRPHLSFADLRATPIALPPPEERRAITARTHALLSQVTDGAAQLDAAATSIDTLRLSVLHKRLGKANGIPHVAIGDVAEVFAGATPSRRDASLWGGSALWVASGEVAFGRIAQTRETITEFALGRRPLHPPGTVMMAMGEGRTRGQAAIRVDQTRMLPDFLFFVLWAQYENNRGAGGGSQQPALNKTRVAALEVPLPDLVTQSEAVRRIRTDLSALQAAETHLRSALARSHALDRSILSAAINGRLVDSNTLTTRVAASTAASA